MKERPLFRDYARQLIGLILNVKPVRSKDKLYTLSDRPMLLLFQSPS